MTSLAWPCPRILVVNRYLDITMRKHLMICKCQREFFQTWLFAIFTRKRCFALFCTLLCSFADLRLRSFALSCVFLRPTAFGTTTFGNSRLWAAEERLSYFVPFIVLGGRLMVCIVWHAQEKKKKKKTANMRKTALPRLWNFRARNDNRERIKHININKLRDCPGTGWVPKFSFCVFFGSFLMGEKNT